MFDFNDLSCAIDEIKSDERAWQELCKILGEKGICRIKTKLWIRGNRKRLSGKHQRSS